VSSADRVVLEAAAKDGISVGREDNQITLRCTEYTDGKIDTEAAHDLAHEHGLVVQRTVSDFDSGAVDVVIPLHGGEADA